MNKETIIDRMQSYFSGKNQKPEFDTSIEMDALQAFYVRTAKRLMIANELQKKDTIYRDDFFDTMAEHAVIAADCFGTSRGKLTRSWIAE